MEQLFNHPSPIRNRNHKSPLASLLRRSLALLTLAISTAVSLPAVAQRPGQNNPNGLSGNRMFNPYGVEFQSQWTAELTDPVKLMEIGQVTDEKRNNLLLFLDSKDPKDYHRQLVITHWDGSRFVRDTSSDFIGTTQDALLVGNFRQTATSAVVTGTPTASPNGKPKKKTQPKAQIVTTEGFYIWNGTSFTRIFAAPPNLRLGLMLEDSPAQLLINSGSNATFFEAGDTDAHPSGYLLDTSSEGYVRLAVGTLNYDGMKDFLPGVRFAQSYWQGKDHWQIGLIRGASLNLQDNADATSGDMLAVYVPRIPSKDKPYWRLRPEDFEECWRSTPLTGRVLDVRVGDPKNEGTNGILVLTAENKGATRRLTFFKPTTPKRF